MYAITAILIIFVILILMVIWGHYIGQNHLKNQVDNSFRDETNVRLYHEHKAEIEKDLEQGNIDDENYQYLLEELEQSLLQDIADNKAEAAGDKKVVGKLSVIWPAVISVFILGFTLYFYSQYGSYQLIANTPQQKAQPQQIAAEEQARNQLAKFAQLIAQQPENGDAWYKYGQALVTVGKFEEAISAFAKVSELEGPQAELFGAQAQAAYYAEKQQITAKVQGFVDQALALDAKDPSTNILLGMDSFIKQNYEVAITYWQKIVDDNRPSVNIEALKGAISEAKGRLSLTGGVVESTDTSKVASGPQLSLKVSIDDSLKTQINDLENKVVFVYAIPTNGARMPVAAVKLKADELPATVVLNDARAMAPQMKLSNVKSVHLYAIISASGSAGIKPGDFKAEIKNVAVTETKSFELVVNSIVE